MHARAPPLKGSRSIRPLSYEEASTLKVCGGISTLKSHRSCLCARVLRHALYKCLYLFVMTRRSPFSPDGMPHRVLWRPEAVDCWVLIPPEAWNLPFCLRVRLTASCCEVMR